MGWFLPMSGLVLKYEWVGPYLSVDWFLPVCIQICTNRSRVFHIHPYRSDADGGSSVVRFRHRGGMHGSTAMELHTLRIYGTGPKRWRLQ